MHSIYHWICALFKRKHRPDQAEIVKSLPAAAQAALMAEAAFLRDMHGVSAHELTAAEKPSAPKAVDASVEAKLPMLNTLPNAT